MQHTDPNVTHVLKLVPVWKLIVRKLIASKGRGCDG